MVLLITSCHINDPRSQIHRADITTVDNQLCVKLPDSEREKTSSLTIKKIGNGKPFFR
ncbi:hypothetical protein [Erwinia mallotivora]|uniref:hypothetical protein n=1 Tax=Erwinia mallotivora TaxID=69222 RepID=UPI0034D434A1